MPRPTEKWQTIYNHTYQLFFGKLSKEEQNALNIIYAHEMKRLTKDDPQIRFDAEAMLEVHKTLFTWVESGIVPLKVAIIADSPDIDIDRLSHILSTASWNSHIGYVITSDYIGPFTAGHQFALANGHETIIIPASYNFWSQVLQTAHAVLVVDSDQANLRRVTQLKSAREAGLFTATINLDAGTIVANPPDFYIAPANPEDYMV